MDAIENDLILAPGQRQVYAVTVGISRNMNVPDEPIGVEPFAQGGGNLNGSAAFWLQGQSGTTGQRIAMPRQGAGNYTGII